MTKATSTRGTTGRRRVSQVHANRKASVRQPGRGKAQAGRASSGQPSGSGKARGNSRATQRAADSRNTRRNSSKGSAGPAPQQQKQSILTALSERVRLGIGRQAHDLIGLGLVLVGVLAMIAFFDGAGSLGRWMMDGLRLLVGVWVYPLPAILMWLGGSILVGWRRHDYRRFLFGTSLWFTGLVSLFHLMVGNAALADGLEAVEGSGGALGSLISFPLYRLLGFWGTFLVTSVVSAAGVMITMRASIREVLVALGESTVRTARAIRARRVAVKTRRSERSARRSEGGQPVHGEAEHRAEPDLPAKEPPTRPSKSRRPTPARAARLPQKPPPRPSEPAKKPKKHAARSDDAPPEDQDGYQLPPVGLLETGGGEGQNGRMIEETARQLEGALRDHEVNARLTNVVPGPTVTRYEIELAPGVKVARVTSLAGDIAYALATPDVRLLAPIPGRSAIGVEVPNRSRRLVTLGNVLASPEAEDADHPLVVGLGEDISGRPVLLNLSELPHVLIAGATGAGKSSCVNSIVTSLLMRARPKDVRLILVDPKRVELGQYNGVPHLLTRVITKPKKALEALQWAVAEMERRYELLEAGGVRDISGYLDKYDSDQLQPERFDRFPYLVVVIDELNDLMMVAGRDVESAIVRIAQMARAVGIHLVIATQRPSVNVITGVIKANIPSRLAFSVASQADSRVIIDTVGADKLIGMGDMLLVTALDPRASRVQGAWVSEDEIAAVVNWVSAQKVREYRQIDEEMAAERKSVVEADEGEDADLIRRATDLVVRSQLGSTSMLQRKFRIGFARAGRIMDILETKGLVGPSEGSKAREVLVTIEELEEQAKLPV